MPDTADPGRHGTQDAAEQPAVAAPARALLDALEAVEHEDERDRRDEAEHPLAESFAADIDAKLSLRPCQELLRPRVLGHILVPRNVIGAAPSY